MDGYDEGPRPEKGKQPMLPKPALVKNKRSAFNHRTKRVAFMPTLQDIHDGLSRKNQEASLDHLSDHATMGTDEFVSEIERFASSNISLCAQASSSICGYTIEDELFPLHSTKQPATQHLRNISNTAMFGDETSTFSGKELHPWSPQDSERYINSVLPYCVSILNLPNTPTHWSLDTRVDDGPHTLDHRYIDVPIDLASTLKYSYLDVDYPSREVGRRSALLLSQSYAQYQIRPSAFPETTLDFDTSPLAHAQFDKLSPTSRRHMPYTTHEHRGKLKRQVKHYDLRNEFRRYGVLAKKTGETVQVKEKSSSSRKSFKRLRGLF